MKDIDFDELDRAVSSLMASAPTETAKTVPPQVAPQPKKDESDESVVPVTITKPAPRPEVSRGRAVAARPQRTGRFMDMVAAPTTASKPQQQQPPSAAVPVEPPATTVDEDDFSNEGLTIGSQAEGTKETGLTINTPLTETDVKSSKDDTIPTSPQIVASSESPFLTDAKVNKRPLNSSTTIDMSELDRELAAESDELTTDPEETDSNLVRPPEVPKAPELDSELVAIESSEPIPEPDTNSIEPQHVVTTSEAAQQVTPPSTPLGATSIAQQYTSHPSTGDQSHAAIYDASQYPEPLAHPAKKKTGWLWVVWVVLLLMIGAGGALGLYALGLIP